MKFDLVKQKLRTIFLTCDVRLLVGKVSEPNQADHLIGHHAELSYEALLCVCEQGRLR